jgi:hypothetical protein
MKTTYQLRIVTAFALGLVAILATSVTASARPVKIWSAFEPLSGQFDPDSSFIMLQKYQTTKEPETKPGK